MIAIQDALHGAGSTLAAFHFAAAQQPDMINSGNSKLLEAFVVITGLSFAIIAIIAIPLVVVVIKAKNEVMAHVVELKGKAMPLIAKSQALVEDLTPQIKEITGKVNQITGKVHEISVHAEEIVAVAKDKVNEFAPTISAARETIGDYNQTARDYNQTARDANQRARQQVDRVNVMVTGALDAAVRLGKAVEHGITQPGRELAGFVASAKSTVDDLLKKSSGAGSALVSKLSGMFTKAKTAGKPVQKPAATRDTQAGKVTPFRSMGDLGVGSVASPGVSSGSGGNGDPIVG